MNASRAPRIHAAVGIGLLLLAGGCWGPAALALTPDSPQVKKAIKKGVAFLESEADEAKDGRVGARALVGLVMIKNHADPKHPRIKEAVTAIQGVVNGHDPKTLGLDIYQRRLGRHLPGHARRPCLLQGDRFLAAVSPGRAKAAWRLGLSRTANRRHLDDPVRRAQRLGGEAGRLQDLAGVGGEGRPIGS